jgi:hypothetical protein
MGVNILSLPIDIPWKRLAVSEDMYASSGSGPLPYKWRSSLAVFSYDPVPDPNEPSNPDEITTFLKIICSVTGLQPDANEVKRPGIGGVFGSQVLGNYQELMTPYYPAYSALLQVAVFPQSGDWAISQYPYLTDFEPKKREVVELVTDTGEATTQSDDSVNVRKGTTSTDSTENVNIDRGGSFGIQGTSPYGGGGLTDTQNKEVGTRSTLGTQAFNLVTTDASREKRESFSHSTNLSQLYQLLDSYHAGMNRALFFLNARPHIVDSPYTFVNGPRRLEGIQEFFLVVRRPKDMESICVRAQLETAHLRITDVDVTTGTTRFDQQQIAQTFTLHASGGHFSASDTPGQWTIPIPDGYKLDRSRGGGTYHITWDGGSSNDVVVPNGVAFDMSVTTDDQHLSEAIPVITPYDDHVDIRVHIYGIQNVTSPEDANGNWTITVFTISVNPVETPQTTTEQHIDLFLTARDVSSCAELNISNSDYVSWEVTAQNLLPGLLIAAKGGRDGAIAANAVSRAIQERVIHSFGSPTRYPPGTVRFLDTNFAKRDLLKGVQLSAEQSQRPLADVAPPDLAGQIRKVAPKATQGEVIGASIEQISSALSISAAQARQLVSYILGVQATTGDQTPPAQGGGKASRSGKITGP